MACAAPAGCASIPRAPSRRARRAINANAVGKVSTTASRANAVSSPMSRWSPIHVGFSDGQTTRRISGCSSWTETTRRDDRQQTDRQQTIACCLFTGRLPAVVCCLLFRDLPVRALEIEQRLAFACVGRLDFTDKDGVVAAFGDVHRAAFQIAQGFGENRCAGGARADVEIGEF